MLFPPFGLFTCRECNRTIFVSNWNFSATDVYLCPNYSQSVFGPFRLDVISWIIYFTSVSIFTWGELILALSAISCFNRNGNIFN